MFLPNEIQPGKFGVDLSSLYAHVSRNECSHTPATLRWKIPKIEVPSWKMNGEFIYPRLPGFGKPWWIRNISISKTEVPFPNLHFCCILDLSISQGFFMLTILIPPSFGCVNSQPPKHPTRLKAVGPDKGEANQYLPVRHNNEMSSAKKKSYDIPLSPGWWNHHWYRTG